MKKIFVTSDIHGHIKHFEQLLTNWDTADQLVILGDLIDRGPESLTVIRKVMALCEQYGDQVLFIKGNHEDMLINFLNAPFEKQENYYRNGGLETLSSFFKPLQLDIPSSLEEVVELISAHYSKELSFIENAPHVYTIGNILFTHAGFNSAFEDYTQTTEREFIWIRKHYEMPNRTPFVNIFGHTPIKYINGQHDILVNQEKNYIAIDGGCYMTGQLNGIELYENGEIAKQYKVNIPLTEGGNRYD